MKKMQPQMIRYFIVLIMISILLLSSLPVGLANDNNNVQSRSSRSPRQSTKTVEGNDKLTLTDGITSFSWVWVKDNATLHVKELAILRLSSGKGRLNVTDNAVVIVEGKIEAYKISANCKSFNIKNNGWLEVQNQKSTLEKADSVVKIHTRDPIEITDGSKIVCKGQDGSKGQTGTHGGGYDGGDGLIELVSDKSVTISKDSTLESWGGKGGDAVDSNTDGGPSGFGKVVIQANGTNASTKASLLISESTVTAQGKSGGKGISPGGIGGDGGFGRIELKSISKEKIELYNCKEIGIYGGQGGSGTSTGFEGDAELDINCNKFYLDEYKKDNETRWLDKDSTKLKFDGNLESFQIKASEGAYLYVPDFDDVMPKAKDTKTMIYIYNILSVTVQDYSGTKLIGAEVNVLFGSVTEGSSDTNDIGKASFLLLAYQITKDNDGQQGYTVKAKLQDVTGTYPEFVTIPNRITDIIVYLSLVSVTFDKVVIGETEFDAVEGMEVGGEITLKGTADSGNEKINKVEFKRKMDELIRTENAITVLGTGNSVTWSFVLDTTEYLDGKKLYVEAIASDGTFTNSIGLNLTINQDIVPDAPQLTILNPKTDSTVTDKESENEHTIMISGTVFDPDWNSLKLSSGKEVIEVSISIKDEEGNTLLQPEKITKDNDLIYNDKNHSYSWSYEWLSRKWNKDTEEYEFPEGKYIIHAIAKDDAQFESIEKTIMITLKHEGRVPSIRPTAVIKSFNAGSYSKKVSYEYMETSQSVEYKFQSEKGQSDVKLILDLSESYDEDGSKSDLTYRVEYKIGSETNVVGWTNSSILTLDYFIYAKEKKEFKSFNVKVQVKDKYDWENIVLQVVDENNDERKDVLNLTIIVEYLPEDPPPSGPLSDIIALELHNDIINIVFLILIVIFNILAGLFIVTKYKKINKRRRGREAALDIAKQKKLSDDKSGKDDLYSHIQYESEETGRVEVAGASAVAEYSGEVYTETDATIEEQLRPVEPEAPKLVSASGPIYESDDSSDEQIPGAEPPAQLQPSQQEPQPALPAATTSATVTPTATVTAAPAAAQPAQPVPAQPTESIPAPVTATTPTTTPPPAPAAAQPAVPQQKKTNEEEEG